MGSGVGVEGGAREGAVDGGGYGCGDMADRPTETSYHSLLALSPSHPSSSDDRVRFLVIFSLSLLFVSGGCSACTQRVSVYSVCTQRVLAYSACVRVLSVYSACIRVFAYSACIQRVFVYSACIGSLRIGSRKVV